jgi:hypothetical protein
MGGEALLTNDAHGRGHATGLTSDNKETKSRITVTKGDTDCDGCKLLGDVSKEECTREMKNGPSRPTGIGNSSRPTGIGDGPSRPTGIG